MMPRLTPVPPRQRVTGIRQWWFGPVVFRITLVPGNDQGEAAGPPPAHPPCTLTAPGSDTLPRWEIVRRPARRRATGRAAGAAAADSAWTNVGTN